MCTFELALKKLCDSLNSLSTLFWVWPKYPYIIFLIFYPKSFPVFPFLFYLSILITSRTVWVRLSVVSTNPCIIRHSPFVSYFTHSCISDQTTNHFSVDRAPYCVRERNKSYQWHHARTEKLFHTLPFCIIGTIFSFLNHIFQVREHFLIYNSVKWEFKEEQRLYCH